MSGKLITQIAVGFVVAVIVKNLSTPAPTTNQMPYLYPQQWAGAGTDPFGTSYTVVGRAARGGM